MAPWLWLVGMFPFPFLMFSELDEFVESALAEVTLSFNKFWFLLLPLSKGCKTLDLVATRGIKRVDGALEAMFQFTVMVAAFLV